MTLADRLISVLYRLRDVHVMDMHEYHDDISISQLEMVRYALQAGPQGCRIQDIAEGMGLSAPTVSVAIKRLEENGWVVKRPDPEDKRASIITVSDRSIQVAKNMKEKQRQMIEWFLSELSPDEQEQLVDLLDRAVTNAEKRNQ